MNGLLSNELLYVIPKNQHLAKELKEILTKHHEIKFVSLIGVDLFGNDMDEKIPIKVFIEDIQTFLTGAIQTDGSSVALPGIASLNNAKVDLVADTDVNWFVDHNYENIDLETSRPTGTLRIPCFLYHDSEPVDSRHILKRSVVHLKNELFELFKKNPKELEKYKITNDDIEDLVVTVGTELEFWVKTPDDSASVEELSTSQVMQEQYWTKTFGSVRTSLEQSLSLLDLYGLNPEMGHKEVGGVRAKIDQTGNLTRIMEQLEIDWKYSEAMQAADNELLARMVIKETFRKNGLDVTFLAKPIDGVAGSGEHTHLGIALKLKNGKRINLFSGPDNHFMSSIGYGSVMGILKNYEVINPIISSTNDSLRRLKPGFEAPISIVTSLGHTVEVPSRNRTVLIGLVRDSLNPLSTRFEIRSPNPHTNTYIAIGSLISAMFDGINYALSKNKSEDNLLSELSKEYGVECEYLEKNRAYRTEEDIFEDFSEEERIKNFGKTPATIFENLQAFEKFPEKTAVLLKGNVLNKQLLESFKSVVTSRWLIEIERRIIPNYLDEIRNYKMLHTPENAVDLDVTNWMTIAKEINLVVKDTHTNKSLITRIKNAIKDNDYELVSNLQITLDNKMVELREAYSAYRRNIIEI